MADSRCHLLKNSTDYHDDLPSIRFALLHDCKFCSIDIMNSLISSLRIPYTLTYHDKFGAQIDGRWNGIIGEIVENRSDIGAASFVVTDERHKVVNFAPILGYGSPISILSGKIHSNTGNVFHIFDSFSTELWIAFGLSLIIVSICEQIFHSKTKYSFLALIMKIFDNIFSLIMRFLNQNLKKFTNICCISHLLLFSSTLISIFSMTLFFNSELLSNILYNPLLNIDSLDDLARFLSTHPDVSLISDNSTITWKLMKTWQDQQVQSLFRKMQSMPMDDFDFEKVYRGKSIIISFDDKMARMLNKKSIFEIPFQ